MELKSHVVSVGEFLRMEKLDQKQKLFLIPKYQREYKWTKDKVKTLISDINYRDKFLGNLLLNKKKDYYEIVDGQQRITTLILILITIFNKSSTESDSDLSEEQKKMVTFLFRNKKFILKNESIGDYCDLLNNKIHINIKREDDIYYQKDTFDYTIKVIQEELEKINFLGHFMSKLLDCKILILINEKNNRETESIEDLFLDINFKSQLLDVADIFKGYCFKNYDSAAHEELKEQWTKIRKNTKEFEDKIGYKESEKQSSYIYHYLLSFPKTYNIPMNLSIEGKHFLEGKNHTETKRIIMDMIEYGNHILEFFEKIKNNDYKFEDICGDIENYKADQINFEILKIMFEAIMLNRNVQYYKFPLFMIIHYLKQNANLKEKFLFNDFKKMTCNYYVYALLFINNKNNKNKTKIDSTIFNELYKLDNNNADLVICQVVKAVQNLRKNYLNDYEQFTIYEKNKAYWLYSLIDNYDANKNFVSEIYTYPNYTPEHLILHNNKNMKVTWKEDEQTINIEFSDLKNKFNKYKKTLSNYIFLPKSLNEKIKDYDIVNKIMCIERYYNNNNNGLPKHINIIFEAIKETHTYTELKDLKNNSKSEEEINEKYIAFINEYFSENHQQKIYDKIKKTFKDSFKN